MSNGHNESILRAEAEQILNLAAQHGVVYIRWASHAQHDMQPGARSRCAISGDTHAGLSAVPVEADMSVSQVAARLAEYSFSRIDKPTARPRIYRAEQVGVDSDGYASIRPVETLREPADEIIEAIDTGAARAIELRESIAADERRLARVTDQFAREIIEAAIARNRAKLCGAS